MPEPLYALLQTRHERIELAALQEALLAGAGLPKADAVRAAHRCRGILAERLTHKQAEGARGSLARRLPAGGLTNLMKGASTFTTAGCYSLSLSGRTG